MYGEEDHFNALVVCCAALSTVPPRDLCNGFKSYHFLVFKTRFITFFIVLTLIFIKVTGISTCIEYILYFKLLATGSLMFHTFRYV